MHFECLLLVGSTNDDLALAMPNGDGISLFGVGKIAHAPLKRAFDVLARKCWLQKHANITKGWQSYHGSQLWHTSTTQQCAQNIYRYDITIHYSVRKGGGAHVERAFLQRCTVRVPLGCCRLLARQDLPLTLTTQGRFVAPLSHCGDRGRNGRS